jgi:microsomal dipeptidase-like Zn-dependent dipeptidase
VGDSLPIGLKNVDDMPNLIEALKKGFTESDIKKLMFENFFRVLQKNIDYSIAH